MEDLLTDLLQRTTEVPIIWGYVVVLSISWLENIVPPIPGDVLIVFAGYLAAAGPMNLIIVILLSTIGGTVGFMCMYGIGYYGGPKLLQLRSMQWIPSESVIRVEKWIHSRGYLIIAANRFLTGARTVISFAVGMNRLNPLPVSLLALLSSALWVTLIAVLGYVVGHQWEHIVDYLTRYGQLVSGLIILFIGWQVIKAIQRFRKKM